MTYDQLLDLANAKFADDDNAGRGARIVAVLMRHHYNDGGNHLNKDGVNIDGSVEEIIGDALADLRHACDLFGLSFWDLNDSGHNHYSAEVLEFGVAK
jgi:hypothetical protein